MAGLSQAFYPIFRELGIAATNGRERRNQRLDASGELL